MNSLTKNVSILFFLSIFIIARFSCTILSNVSFMSMSFIFVYGSVFLTIFLLHYNKMDKLDFIALVFICLYGVYVFFTSVPFYGQVLNNQVFNVAVIIFLYFIYLYMKNSNFKKKIFIFKTAMIGYFFTWVYSIFQLVQDPTISRRMAANIVVDNNIDTLGGVGGFDTVYGSLLILCILIYLLNEKKINNRKLILFALINCICFIFLASYGTAVVLLFVVLSMYLMKKNKFTFFIVMLILFLVLIFRENVGSFIQNISNKIVFSDILRMKINEIGEMLVTGQSAGTLAGTDGRFARMGWSIQTFLKYPIFGGITKPDATIGYHSELIDMLGRYGIFGTLLFLIFFCCFLKSSYKLIKSESGKKCFFTVLCVYIIMAVLNPALYTQQVLPFFIILPFYDFFLIWKGVHNEKNTNFSSLQ